MAETLTEQVLDGVTVKASDGFIYWTSDWARIGELFDAGLVTKREGGAGTYGHVDYYVKG